MKLGVATIKKKEKCNFLTCCGLKKENKHEIRKEYKKPTSLVSAVCLSVAY
jgi:gluconate kinase